MRNLLIAVTLLFSGSAFGQSQFVNETVGMLTYNSGHVIQLAEAIPADKYSWTPEEGVRNVAQVCGHIISANYFFAMKMGATLPEGVNPQTIEQELTTKEQVVPALKKSYEVLFEGIKSTSDEALAQKVEFPFPGEYTTMSAILIAMNHSYEHMGQLVAYGRMNGITPPWSQKPEGESGE